MNRPEVHDVLRRWRELADAAAPPRVLVGETYVLELDQLIPFYGTGEDELNLAFNFLFVHAELAAGPLRTIVEGVEAKLPAGRVAGLHGLQPRRRPAGHALGGGRPAARPRGAAHADDACAARRSSTTGTSSGCPRSRPTGAPRSTPSRAAPGTRRATAIAAARRCRGRARRAAASPRTASRRGSRSATSRATSRTQRGDPASTLHLVRDLIALRRAAADLRTGAYATLPAPDGAWAWRRGDGFVVAVNLADGPAEVAGLRRGPDRDRHRPRARRRGRGRSARARPLGGGGGAGDDRRRSPRCSPTRAGRTRRCRRRSPATPAASTRSSAATR